MITWLMQSQADVGAPPLAWLSPAEQAEYAALRAWKRRQDWLLGRWTAKRLIQAVHAEAAASSLDTIELSPACGRAPHAAWPGGSGPWPLSISHCDGHGAAALADDPGTRLGIDLELVEARPAGFAEAYYTPAEQESLCQALAAQAERMTAIWCAKEAALKALGVGLTVDTRAINVWLDRGQAAWQGWRRLEVDVVGARLPEGLASAGDELRGWWRRCGPYLLAIVSSTAHNRAAGWPVEVELAAGWEKMEWQRR